MLDLTFEQNMVQPVMSGEEKGIIFYKLFKPHLLINAFPSGCLSPVHVVACASDAQTQISVVAVTKMSSSMLLW